MNYPGLDSLAFLNTLVKLQIAPKSSNYCQTNCWTPTSPGQGTTRVFKSDLNTT